MPSTRCVYLTGKYLIGVFGFAAVDVVFEVDDGTVCAHRALLTCRSDVMASMFTNDFLEKSAKLVICSHYRVVQKNIRPLTAVSQKDATYFTQLCSNRFRMWWEPQIRNYIRLRYMTC